MRSALVTIGLLSKKRGNYALQERFAGASGVKDATAQEVAHHRQALQEAGYRVQEIAWGAEIITQLQQTACDLFFNVSSLAEAALLEDLDLPYVGSDTSGIALARDKSLAKRLWQQAGLPTSPFVVARRLSDCEAFASEPPFPYPLFVKPLLGRGSAGVDEDSVIEHYGQLMGSVQRRLELLGQPVLIERYLQGREITIGVVGNDAAMRALPPLEIRYGDGDCTLTYEKKERDDSLFVCPADLAPDDAGAVQQLALDAFGCLGLLDYGRIDTMLTAEGPMLLEANSFAGLTTTPPEKPHAYLGFMARAEGKGGAELLGEIVAAARERLGL